MDNSFETEHTRNPEEDYKNSMTPEEFSALERRGYSLINRLNSLFKVGVLVEAQNYGKESIVLDIHNDEAWDKEQKCDLFSSGYFNETIMTTSYCPGWKFGIWWSSVASNIRPGDDVKRFEGTVFGEYTECIDKFKPSHAAFSEKFIIDFDEVVRYAEEGVDEIFDAFPIYRMLEFIHNEPELAWYYDRHYSFSHEHYDHCERKDAKREFKEWRHNYDKAQALQTEAVSRLASKLANNINKLEWSGAILYRCDLGADSTPSSIYELWAPIEENRHWLANPEATGYYSLFPTWEECDEEPRNKKACKRAAKLGAKLKRIKDKYKKKISNLGESWWGDEIDIQNIFICNAEDMEGLEKRGDIIARKEVE